MKEVLSAGSDCVCLMQPLEHGISVWIKVSGADIGGSRLPVNMPVWGQCGGPMQPPCTTEKISQEIQKQTLKYSEKLTFSSAEEEHIQPN